jgi:mycothiol synthase
VRAVAGVEEAAARAALHRAAFPHSHNSTEVYERLMTSRHYRRDLDLVVVAPGGAFASMALAWLDARNKTGEFEPVATDPAHSRRGLASAANQEGMRRLREHGATAAIVYAQAESAASVELHKRLGFMVVDTNQGFARP